MSKRYIIFHGGNVLLTPDNRFPEEAVGSPAGEIYHPSEDTVAYALTELPSDLKGLRECGLRDSYRVLPADDYRLAAKGAELLFWDRNRRFCPACGTPLRRNTEISKICPKCGSELFPSLSPAVLVLVRRDDKALLVHARNFKRPFFGLVAGFVETGESLEECVAREVKEETSLDIKNIRYFGSQSWPFPFNMMIGFTADYAGGEIRFADEELSEGRFFGRDEVPELATPPSLARTMIDSWLFEK